MSLFLHSLIVALIVAQSFLLVSQESDDTKKF